MFQHVIIVSLCVYYVTCEHLNLYEGSECTWKGTQGQCVSIFRCLSTFIDIQNKDYAPICSFKDREPIICCTDCDLVNDTRSVVLDPQLGILYKTGSKAKDKCVEYMHALNYSCKYNRKVELVRVHHPERNCYHVIEKQLNSPLEATAGVDAQREEFPHMALLGYGDDATNADWLCGGSVISERFILTAAHCLSSPAVGPVRYVALGILRRSDPSNLWQIYNVKTSQAHPQYKPPSKYHDIALLETDRTISFEDQVRPACLHAEGEADRYASATGWGALGHRKKLADNLQAVYVTSFDEKECSRFYPPHRHLKNGYDHKTQMCYGDKLKPKDTCEGDSGGPLQSSNYGNGCVYTILGVTSYGRQCGISGGSGMYTRVHHYVPWIESVVWP